MDILFADDNVDIRKVVKLILERSQPEVTVCLAKSGQAAVARVKSGQQFDLVLLDNHMPPYLTGRSGESGGVWACRELRTLTPYTPIVFLSAYTAPVEIRRAREAGAYGYISKDILAKHDLLSRLLALDWLGLQAMANERELWCFPENLAVLSPAAC